MNRYEALAARMTSAASSATPYQDPPIWRVLFAASNLSFVWRWLLSAVILVGPLVWWPWTRHLTYALAVLSLPIAVLSVPTFIILAFAIAGRLSLSSWPEGVALRTLAFWWSWVVLTMLYFHAGDVVNGRTIVMPNWLAYFDIFLLFAAIIFAALTKRFSRA